MKNRPSSGFTLIELTVVLLILIALAGLAIPYIGGTSQTALCNATDVTMQNIKKVIMERYYLDTLGYFPKDKKDTVTNDYDLTYLFIPNEWSSFDPETQLGWRGEYLQNGIDIGTNAPNNSFKKANGKTHTDIIGTHVLDAWGRPIIIQAYCSNSTYTTKSDCETNSALWIARLVSAGSGSGVGLDNAEINTAITDVNGINDDRILYLNKATPKNPSC